jgi:hypothetical protein
VEISGRIVEELLENFLAAALGLTLVSRIDDVSQLPEAHIRKNNDPHEGERACVAWHTDRGRVIACGMYQHEQSRRMKAHVLWFEWWIPANQHHEGWWRCEPKWPRDWIKGAGSPYS